MEVDPDDFKKLLGLLQQLVEKSSTESQQSPKKSNLQDRGDDEDIDEDDSFEEEDERDEEDEEEFSLKQSPIKKSNRKTNKISDVKPSRKKKKFVNKFLNMKEASMHKDDSIIDKKLNRAPPTQRTRHFEYVQVKCRVCGKTEKVIPTLAEARDRYKCNRCSASPG